MFERIRARTTNDYGKDLHEQARIVGEIATVEPRLRATATHEIDATRPLGDVVDALVAIAAAARAGVSPSTPPEA
jgi:hypothetical protein